MDNVENLFICCGIRYEYVDKSVDNLLISPKKTGAFRTPVCIYTNSSSSAHSSMNKSSSVCALSNFSCICWTFS